MSEKIVPYFWPCLKKCLHEGKTMVEKPVVKILGEENRYKTAAASHRPVH
jgi:hypothetical protein